MKGRTRRAPIAGGDTAQEPALAACKHASPLGGSARRARAGRGSLHADSLMRVNSLMILPGIPDFHSRRRIVAAGRVQISGRAYLAFASRRRLAVSVR